MAALLNDHHPAAAGLARMAGGFQGSRSGLKGHGRRRRRPTTSSVGGQHGPPTSAGRRRRPRVRATCTVWRRAAAVARRDKGGGLQDRAAKWCREVIFVTTKGGQDRGGQVGDRQRSHPSPTAWAIGDPRPAWRRSGRSILGRRRPGRPGGGPILRSRRAGPRDGRAIP